jgi:hypothetical protein
MKDMKPVSKDKGPFDISVDIKWITFLGIIAEKLAIQPSNLVITSLTWHWLKPASGPWLSVQDKNRFMSMLRKIKSKAEPYVIVCMQAPTQKKVAGSLGNAWDVEDKLESDFEDNSIAKKVRVLYHLSLYLVLSFS